MKGFIKVTRADTVYKGTILLLNINHILIVNKDPRSDISKITMINCGIDSSYPVEESVEEIMTRIGKAQ